MSRFLVSLIMEAILKEQKVSTRRYRLETMMSGSGDFYDGMLSRVQAQDEIKVKIGIAALMWVSHSERPLRVAELSHALAVEVGSADLDPENVPSMGTLLNCCQGLVVVDEEASTVRLIHSTLQEYLSTCRDLFDGAHSTIAETCLTYLNFQRFKSLSASDLSDPVQTPFLGYSSIYWGTHAKRELSDCAKSLALKLFDDYDGHISIKLLLKHVSNPGRFDDSKDLPSFTGLHCASFFGILEVVAVLVEMNGCDINQIDCVGNTPLMWAAVNGHERVVELLLGQDYVNPNKPDFDGRTPLLMAAQNGNEEVAKLLLCRDDVNPDRLDVEGQTPLSWAARNGYKGIVKTLLYRGDVNPDRLDAEGRTPLSWAAQNGYEGIVKMLLYRDDVNPDRPDTESQTPLSWAARNGHERIVKLLLCRDDVNPNSPATEGQTPLSWAARNGHEGIVKMLLHRDNVNPDGLDTEGQTPLSWAARSDHEGVVKLLPGRGYVNLDRPETEDWTPPSGAAEKGHGGAANLLRKRKDVTPDILDRASHATSRKRAKPILPSHHLYDTEPHDPAAT